MKNTFFKTFSISLVFLGIGCGSDFLEVKPTQYISLDQIKEASKLNPKLQKSNMSGIYSNMYKTGTGGVASAADDFGHRGYDIYTDILSGDMALFKIGYGWYARLADLKDTEDFVRNTNYKPWRYYYRIIRGANTVIEGLGGVDAELKSDEAKYFMGQARAMRAYGYFYLANLFAKEYKPEEKILPIYTNTIDPNKGKSTTKEVYDFMITDLKSAIELLETFTRSAKNEVDKTVAQGLLAYVYAASGDWTESGKMSEAVISSGKYTIMTKDEVVGGFRDINTKGWMWGVDLTTEIGLDLISWWGQIDIFTYSYAAVGNTKTMDEGLYNQIKNKDIRKTQFYVTSDGDKFKFYLTPYKKFYTEKRKVSKGQRTITTDYVYMRISEMYLLSAEAKAHTGDESGSKSRLKDLLKQRFDNASDYAYIDALSGQSLLDEVYLQTRIELWGEGKSYLAMKRNKATITRGNNHFYHAGESFPYNDSKLTFEIPQSEIQNNPHISKE